MTNILIAGCGDIGTALGLQLAKQQHQVWGLRRHGQLPEPIHTLTADLSNPANLTIIPEVLDFVFFTVAASEYSDENYYQTYVGGLKNLLSALKNKPQRIFFISSTAVYHQQNAEWVDESTITEPNHFSGKRMLEAETVLAQANIPYTIIRFGGIYGSGRTRMIDNVRQGSATLSEQPIYTNRIHRDDCVGMLLHLMTLTSPNHLYLGVDNEPAAKNDVIHWLAQSLGIDPSTLKTDANTHPLRGNKRCSNKKLLATGYQFIYPSYREGYVTFGAKGGRPL